MIYGQYRSIFNHCHIIGLKICRIPWKKLKIRAITKFKVIEVGTNRKTVCDFLLVINSNWHPISYRFGVISAYCSNFGHFAFLSPPMGGLGSNVWGSSQAHWKARSGLPISVIELFSLGVTAEALRTNIGAKLAISLQRRPVDPKLPVEWLAPHHHFSSQKTRLNGLSQGIQIWTDLSSVLSQSKRLTDERTDGRTDSFLIARPHLHCMERGKNKRNRSHIKI